MDTKKAREQIFRHLDGMVTVPVALSLYKKGILDFFLQQQKTDLETLTNTFNANKGYLNVACRTLASQGFLEYQVDNVSEQIIIGINSKTVEFVQNLHWYELVSELTKQYDVEDFMGKEAKDHHFVFDVFQRFVRSEEHTSALQSRPHLVCRLLLE